MTTSTALLSDVDLLRRLVSFDTTSHRSNLPLADFLHDYLDRPGIRIDRVPSADGEKTNLVAVAGPEVDPEERAGLVLSGHLDVVPAEEPEWTSDPFELTERDGRLVGRGACDMKGFVALAVNALAGADPTRLRHPLALVLTYDEEVGTLGARRFADRWPADRPLPRRTLVGEPTSLEAVRMHKGHLKMRLTISGRSAHSGYPHLGHNAIEPAGRAVAALGELRRRLETERCPNGEHFQEVPFVALNVATIHGGTAINVVPERCVIEVGFRLLPGMEPGPTMERLGAAVAGALSGESYELEEVNETPPFLLDDDNDFYRDFLRFLGQEEGRSVNYGSDAGWLQRRGLDCLLWGPGDIGVAHRPDEHLDRAELERGGEMLGRAVARYCGDGR